MQSSVSINHTSFHQKGIAINHQIALILIELNNTLVHLPENKIEHIEIHFSVSCKILQEISKIKALRLLTQNLVKAYHPNYLGKLPQLIGHNNTRYFTSSNYELNLIRQTLQAVAMRIGECDNIQLQAYHPNHPSAQQISNNIILLLNEEVKLQRFLPNVDGAEYIEKLIHKTAQESWLLFQNNVGKNCAEKWINEYHATEVERYKNKKEILVGVNKYKNTEHNNTYDIEREL